MQVAGLALLAAVLAAPGLLHAQQPRPARPTASADERAVLALEEAWPAAVAKRDVATFRRLLAPGFVYTEDDRMQTAEEMIHDLATMTDTVTGGHNEDMRAHSFGNTIVVTGWLVMQGRSGGKPFERRYRFTDTWLRRNGQWQIIAAQDYLVPSDRK
jgi:ketosteroid isomerase-like protein